ncbi:rhodanese-like domain-containing protein [Streptomyces fumanus]|uniref:Rhodanese domain-containing protein n=1 Tax=Streptomyces fumanus TaxID=67302 RepID=A0A919ACP9_9ACTN|nr:rhodanese-like domain-containing protein [Streptomyces fumanus]GHE97270.1 hypothetical protein GCM10018772_21840 [Streptomyces fumanus]
MLSPLRRRPGRLTPRPAHQRTSDGTAVLLDVREPPEWNAGHAPDALRLPLVHRHGVPAGLTARARAGLPVVGPGGNEGAIA